MTRYIIKRIGYGIAIIITVIIVISSIIYLIPVDPTRLSFGQLADARTVEKKREAMGLDKPLAQQLVIYLRDLSPIVFTDKAIPSWEFYKDIGFNIGSNRLALKWPYLRDSYQSGRPVSEILSEAIPVTILLTLTSILFASLFGIVLGVLSAIKHNTWIEQLALFFSTVGYSLPSYATAILFAVFFAIILGSITGLNLTGSLFELDDNGNRVVVIKNLILPVLALGLRPVSIITQLTRSAMLDNFTLPYVRTGKAKGLTQKRITYMHVLKNALNPVITGISGWFASLIAGAFFVENVFNFRGLGSVTVKALLDFDIPVILGAVLFTCLMFVIINIIVDLLYAYFDPRIRY